MEDEHGEGAPQEAGSHGKGVSLSFIVGLLVAVAAVGYIIMDGADDAVFAYTVDQASEKNDDLVGKRFRVRGTVQEGSLQQKPGTLDVRFDLVHSAKVITVAYDKPLPDTFKAGIEVIAEGELDSNNVLQAENVIAKCPSKYEEGAPTAKEAPHGPGGPEGMDPAASPKKAY
jgi:cytochrome c-type biogenesis protein CcmE